MRNSLSGQLLISLLLTSVSHVTDGAEKMEIPKLRGLRVEDTTKVVPYRDDYIVRVIPDSEISLRLFGANLFAVDEVLFSPLKNGCVKESESLLIDTFPQQDTSMLSLKITFPSKEQLYYICFKLKPPESSMQSDGRTEGIGDKSVLGATAAATTGNSSAMLNATNGALLLPQFFHQGHDHYKLIGVAQLPKETYMPIAVQSILICCLLCLSGLFSGLNLGLMALDQTELQIILNSGSKREKQYAKIIIPVRKSGNYLLCSLLLGNVIVNSAVSILLDDLTSGPIALVGSTLGIVILGEIIPQSVCSRYGLAVGAKTIYITRFFMLLTSPLSWPISKVLDKILGEEVGHVYNRERLLELIRLSKETQGELNDCQEVAIVSGALELGHKTVKDVMTHIRDVYMLDQNAVLDSKTVGAIVKSGYTRIPVYETTRNNVVTLLNVKDLALLDPDDRIPVKTVCQFYMHQVRFVFEDVPLSVMLDEFKKGHYHMAFVHRVNSDGPGDPYRELSGVVTLEDIIEEIIQSEIIDETDVITDNRQRIRRKETQVKDFSSLFSEESHPSVSPQLSMATFQYLSTSLEPFAERQVSEHVLQRLIKQNVVELKAPEQEGVAKFLYQRDKPSDIFILILEGRVEVTTGKDNFVFEAGPFFYFGKQVLERMCELAPRLSFTMGGSTATLTGPTNDEICRKSIFSPDFTVKVTHDIVYLSVKAATYLKAFHATLIERVKEGQLGDGLMMVERGSEVQLGNMATPSMGSPDIPEDLEVNKTADRPVGLVRPNVGGPLETFSPKCSVRSEPDGLNNTDRPVLLSPATDDHQAVCQQLINGGSKKSRKPLSQSASNGNLWGKAEESDSMENDDVAVATPFIRQLSARFSGLNFNNLTFSGGRRSGRNRTSSANSPGGTTLTVANGFTTANPSFTSVHSVTGGTNSPTGTPL